nr:MAG TPA: hypothetical protein [Bacteriophage sp.]
MSTVFCTFFKLILLDFYKSYRWGILENPLSAFTEHLRA